MKKNTNHTEENITEIQITKEILAECLSSISGLDEKDCEVIYSER